MTRRGRGAEEGEEGEVGMKRRSKVWHMERYGMP